MYTSLMNGNKTCEVLKVELIFLSSLANYLLQLCMYVIEYRRGVFHWLFAMPLLHFLSDTSKPFSFEELTSEPGLKEDNNWWGTQGLDFKTVRRQASFSR